MSENNMSTEFIIEVYKLFLITAKKFDDIDLLVHHIEDKIDWYIAQLK